MHTDVSTLLGRFSTYARQRALWQLPVFHLLTNERVAARTYRRVSLTAKSFTGPETIMKLSNNLTVRIEILFRFPESFESKSNPICSLHRTIDWLLYRFHKRFFLTLKLNKVELKLTCQAFQHIKPTAHDRQNECWHLSVFVDQISMSFYLLTGCQVYLRLGFSFPTADVSSMLSKRDGNKGTLREIYWNFVCCARI